MLPCGVACGTGYLGCCQEGQACSSVGECRFTSPVQTNNDFDVKFEPCSTNLSITVGAIKPSSQVVYLDEFASSCPPDQRRYARVRVPAASEVSGSEVEGYIPTTSASGNNNLACCGDAAKCPCTPAASANRWYFTCIADCADLSCDQLRSRTYDTLEACASFACSPEGKSLCCSDSFCDFESDCDAGRPLATSKMCLSKSFISPNGVDGVQQCYAEGGGAGCLQPGSLSCNIVDVSGCGRDK